MHDARVGFEVEDAGPGVLASDAPHIFEPFFTTRHTGSGLGLAMSRRIARRLGGDLTLETCAPSGARFRLWLERRPKSED
jgi:signal transduction histidine kinase